MTVLELARRTGVPPSVVRFYARSRILPPHHLAAGGMGYDDADAVRLRLVTGLHRMGVRRISRAAASTGAPEV